MNRPSLIDELIQKYNLKEGEDLWWHKQSGKWLIRHHTMQTIFDQNGLRFPVPNPDMIWSGENYHRHLQICEDEAGQIVSWAYGEANAKTCGIGYYAVMAHYRGIALSGKRAIGWGGQIYSEHEADWNRSTPTQEDRPQTTFRGTGARPTGRPHSGAVGTGKAPAHGGQETGSQRTPRTQGRTQFPPAPWKTVEEVRRSVMNGDPPAFDDNLLLKFVYKSGKYSNLDWIDGYMRDYQQNGGKTPHIEAQIGAITERMRNGEASDFEIKKLQTMCYIRTRLDPRTGQERALEQCTFPASWTPEEPGAEEPEPEIESEFDNDPLF